MVQYIILLEPYLLKFKITMKLKFKRFNSVIHSFLIQKDEFTTLNISESPWFLLLRSPLKFKSQKLEKFKK